MKSYRKGQSSTTLSFADSKMHENNRARVNNKQNVKKERTKRREGSGEKYEI